MWLLSGDVVAAQGRLLYMQHRINTVRSADDAVELIRSVCRDSTDATVETLVDILSACHLTTDGAARLERVRQRWDGTGGVEDYAITTLCLCVSESKTSGVPCVVRHLRAHAACVRQSR